MLKNKLEKIVVRLEMQKKLIHYMNNDTDAIYLYTAGLKRSRRLVKPIEPPHEIMVLIIT